MKSKNIIAVENGKKYEYDDIENMVNSVLGSDYYKLSDEKKLKRLRLRTYMNAGLRNIPVIDIKNGDMIEDVNKEQFVILNEIIFLVSLAKNKCMTIYEKEGSNQFTQDIDISKLEHIAKEYVRISDCANQILKREIEKVSENTKNIKEKKEDRENMSR